MLTALLALLFQNLCTLALGLLPLFVFEPLLRPKGCVFARLCCSFSVVETNYMLP